MTGTVVSLSTSDKHTFSKQPRSEVRLIEGIGLEGDAHAGETVKHRSRVAKDPTQPNLRQVHLIHTELLTELASAGFDVKPGDLGENITTEGLDLLGLPRDTQLHIGDTAVVQVTGLRNPCRQLDGFSPGLMSACIEKDDNGALILKSGIMGIVLEGGTIQVGDTIGVTLPTEPHIALERV